MALWLIDTTQFPGYLSVILGQLSDPAFEGHLDNVAADAFGDWVTKMTTSYQGHYVIGAGAFKQKYAALIARARVVKLESGSALARYLREEILVVTSADGKAESSHRRSARPHITAKIHGLRAVLTAICEVVESRVAELTKTGAAVAARSYVRRQQGSPVIAVDEKAGTGAAAPGVSAQEQGAARGEESGRGVAAGEDARQRPYGGERGRVGRDTLVGASAAEAVTTGAVAEELRASSCPTCRTDAEAQSGDSDQLGGEVSATVSALRTLLQSSWNTCEFPR